jgi:PPP family 3-phenylpropionic acid transporter
MITALVGAFYFFYFSVIGVYIIYLPKVLVMIGYQPFEIGVIFAAAPLMRFVVPFLFLKHIDLDSRVFIISLLISTVSVLLFIPLVDHFILFLLLNLLFGIGMSLTLPYVEVIALEHIQKERYGKIRLFGSIGFALVALVLAQYLTIDSALGSLFVLVVLTSLFGYFIAKNEHKQRASVPSQGAKPFSMQAHWGLWVSVFLMQMSFGAFYNFFTNYESDMGLALDTISYLWTFGVVAEIILFYFQAPLLRFNLLNLIFFATFITMIRWLIFYFYPTNVTVLYFAQSMHAVSFALYHTAVISYLFTLYHQRKLAQQFLFGVSYGLGGFIGALIAGAVYEYDASFLYLSSAIMTLFALVALMHEKRKVRV